MITRRTFLRHAAAGAVGILTASAAVRVFGAPAEQKFETFKGADVFDRILAKALSQHPENYRQLKAHPEMVPRIRQIEDEINSRSLKFIPIEKLVGVEPMLQTGDIVGICTSAAGIDIAHTGLVIRDDAGVARFMDASSAKSKMKVTLEPGPISESLKSSKKATGAMFGRPLEL
jgi:hypothetical protein